MKIGIGRRAECVKAIQLIEFVSGQAWRCRRDIEELFSCSAKTAQRWKVSLEEAGIPLEFTEDKSRFRRMK